jgi:hypothetical protein
MVATGDVRDLKVDADPGKLSDMQQSDQRTGAMLAESSGGSLNILTRNGRIGGDVSVD